MCNIGPIYVLLVYYVYRSLYLTRKALTLCVTIIITVAFNVTSNFIYTPIIQCNLIYFIYVCYSMYHNSNIIYLVSFNSNNCPISDTCIYACMPLHGEQGLLNSCGCDQGSWACDIQPFKLGC